ncbi:hypothetical protein SEA_DUMPTRUCK_45 [Gordonia phage DumpTruck]|nr:hypothetical protein SEA_DUMPTRUCK_45 [Gordonia phage DumpTruck]
MARARTTKELNLLTDSQLASLQDDLYEQIGILELESRRIADIRHERLLGIRRQGKA